MALLYRAELTPSKIEMLAAWVPTQPWGFRTAAADLAVLGAYRFDDPNGEVGIETFLLSGPFGQVLQVPVTYRGEPSDQPEISLITPMQHSVLGPRWVYDACADPVYVRALATAILSGGAQAALEYATETGVEPCEVTTHVRGSGAPGMPIPATEPLQAVSDAVSSVIMAGNLDLTVLRLLDPATGLDPATEVEVPAGAATLSGTWPGQDEPVLLAFCA